MSEPRRGPGRRPGPRPHRAHGPLGPNGDTGAVTLEAAVSLLALVLAVVALVWGMSLVGAQLAVGEASRAAARSAARGAADSDVVAEARRTVTGAEVRIVRDAARVEVEVAAVAAPPGLLGGLGSFRLTSRSTAAREPEALP
jgi:hypothetical protein